MFNNILETNVADQSSHAVNVVGEDDAADGLNEDHETSFLVASWNNVPEPYRQHYSRAPVIRPNVFLVPRSVRYPLGNEPVGV